MVSGMGVPALPALFCFIPIHFTCLLLACLLSRCQLPTIFLSFSRLPPESYWGFRCDVYRERFSDQPPTVVSSHSLIQYPVLLFITASYFYTVLFFQLVYCLSLFTSRPHWRHLLLNAQQLEECLAYNMYLRKGCGWVGRGDIWLDK